MPETHQADRTAEIEEIAAKWPDSWRSRWLLAMAELQDAKEKASLHKSDDSLQQAYLDAGGRLFEIERAIGNEIVTMLKVGFKDYGSGLKRILAELVKDAIADAVGPVRVDVKDIAQAVVAIEERTGKAP